jgi:hypothetical protein
VRAEEARPSNEMTIQICKTSELIKVNIQSFDATSSFIFDYFQLNLNFELICIGIKGFSKSEK